MVYLPGNNDYIFFFVQSFSVSFLSVKVTCIVRERCKYKYLLGISLKMFKCDLQMMLAVLS